MLLPLLGVLLAQAAEPDPAETMLHELTGDIPTFEPSWDTWGSWKARVEHAGDPILDDAGTRAGRSTWFRNRLLLGARYRPTEATMAVAELELLNGQIAGDLAQIGQLRPSRRDLQDPARVLPRQLFVRFDHPIAGAFDLGVQTLHWGLGLRHNHGLGDHGDPWQGDTWARVAWRLSPWKQGGARSVQFLLSADVAVRTPDTELLSREEGAAIRLGVQAGDGDDAIGLLTSVHWRDQQDGTTVRTVPLDLFGSLRLGSEDHGLTLGGEVIVEPGPGTLGIGAMARVVYEHRRLTADLTSGIATGRIGDQPFALHPDHQAGLLLFEQVLPFVNQLASAYPRHRGVQDAVYVEPRFSQGFGVLEADVGLLAGWRPTGSYLGTELRGGLRLRFPMGGPIAELGVEGAGLWTGRALAAPEPVGIVRGRVGIDW